MVFAPPPCDRLHGLAFEGEPGLSLRRVRGQRVLEATEGLALSQRLPERPGEAVIAALIDEVLHDAEGLGRLDGFDEQPAVVIAGLLVGFVVGIGSDQGQDRPGLDVQPVAALPERVARVQPRRVKSRLGLRQPSKPFRACSRGLRAQVSSSRSMVNTRATAPPRAGGVPSVLTSRSPRRPTRTGRTRRAALGRRTAGARLPRTRASGPSRAPSPPGW